jgi:hypothetical protein
LEKNAFITAVNLELNAENKYPRIITDKTITTITQLG